MKILYPIFLLIFSTVDVCFSQDTTAGVIYIDKMPPEGILLHKGWKFHAGDNLDWAKQEYDDSKWTKAALSDYNTYLPQFKTKNVGWFRLHLLIDSLIQKKQLAVQLSQLGASEIYLNGRLFQQLGNIQTPLNYKSFNPADKPLLLPFSTGDSIIIAIRFASEVPSRLWLFTNGNRLPLTVGINSWRNAFDTYETNTEHARMHTNLNYLFAALAFLFILLYVLFPKEKVNLLFGLAWLFAVTRFLLTYELSQGNLDINGFGLMSFLAYSNDIVEGILFLSINSIIIFNRITVYLRIIFFFLVIDDLRFLFFGSPFDAFNFVMHVTVIIAFFHLSVSAFRRRIYIIGIGALNGCILNVIFLLLLVHLIELNLENFVAYIMTANFILITIYLARNFAVKSKNLEIQLIEVKKLSEDNLKKETEKNALALQMAALETKALRAQMNPHFVFNALNAIKKFLLKNDTANADKYLSSFAKLQRLVLDNTRESKVVLENEIKLLELYLRLEHLRFEDRLTCSIHVDEKINPAETEIPSMLIQPFVENAIVHGLQHKTGKGEIKISFCQEDGWIKAIIEDDGIGRTQAASFHKNNMVPHKSLATKISKERLLVLGKDKNIPSGIEIIDLYDEQKTACGTRVIICIPVE